MNYSKGQLNTLIILRLLIGWHLLYEGVLKMYDPSWTAKGFLMSANGPFKGLFTVLGSESVIGMVDFLNVFGLVAVGLGLLLGAMTTWASIGGIIMLSLYYLSHPPFPGLEQSGPAEGSYMIINKNLIEICALFILIKFPTSQYFGLDHFLKKRKTSETNTV